MLGGDLRLSARLARWIETRPSGVWVGFVGFGSIAVGAVGYFMRLDQAPTIAFLLLGSGLVFASPLLDRLEGTQKLSGTGFEMNVLAHREREIAAGEVLSVETSTPTEPSDTVNHPEEIDQAQETDVHPSKVAGTLFTRAAYEEFKRLDRDSRRLALAGLVVLGTTPIEHVAHLKPLPTWQRDYYLYLVAPNVRLVVRQLDKTSPEDPPQYIVVQVLTGRWQR